MGRVSCFQWVGGFPVGLIAVFSRYFVSYKWRASAQVQKNGVNYRGWFQRFGIFSLGEMIQFDQRIFSNGLVQFAIRFYGVRCWCVPCKKGLYAKKMSSIKVLGIYIDVQHRMVCKMNPPNNMKYLIYGYFLLVSFS